LRNTNRGAAPANETQIQNLPSVTLDEVLIGIFLCLLKLHLRFMDNILNYLKKKEKSSQCAICMDDFVVAELAKQLPCKHIFHEPCISQWLKIVSYFYLTCSDTTSLTH
jgi:hypothetical protein